MYKYKATVTKVYDGDTITVDTDLGFGFWSKKMKLRLYGINTPEVRGSEREEGLVVRDYVRELILNNEIYIRTHKDSKGKFGRYLAEVYLDDKSMDKGWKYSLNNKLIKGGMAKEFMK